VETDTTSVAAANLKCPFVRLVKESLLKRGILLWKGLLLPPYIRARTAKLAVKRPSQGIT
jgi:hypothetical protein